MYDLVLAGGTVVDAGSAGAGSFLGFKEFIVDRSRVPAYAFLHISSLGLLGAMFDAANLVIAGEAFDARYTLVGPAVEVGHAFPDPIRGIKVRTRIESSGSHGVGPLVLAIQAAEELGVPVMIAEQAVADQGWGTPNDVGLGGSMSTGVPPSLISPVRKNHVHFCQH